MEILSNCPNLWQQSKCSQSRVHPYIYLYPTPGITGPQSVQIHTRASCRADATSVPASQETFQGDVSDAGWVTDSAARGTVEQVKAAMHHLVGHSCHDAKTESAGANRSTHISPCSCPKSHTKPWVSGKCTGTFELLALFRLHIYYDEYCHVVLMPPLSPSAS